MLLCGDGNEDAAGRPAENPEPWTLTEMWLMTIRETVKRALTFEIG